MSLYKTKLPYDICRCVTKLCPERETCLRWLTIEADKLALNEAQPVRLSYSRDMCGLSGGQFDGVYKIVAKEIK